ncbi:hypothetical protein GALMADRAFT_402807 [Galerina marginata CBS 339.88]|uniref:Uncharacterized protein n=1 Tax=Galerina marginata (strain CBS 339.88) TaxID=685588 RepID=A0A067TUU0_GALM3|nr:hypothetical protein GALMADRAFT_402807 [Galerina marginata CBS 339.88]
MSWQSTSCRLPHDPCTLQDGKPCPACSDAAEIELQIAETEKSLAALKSRRFTIRSEMNRIHSSIILKIPPEIFSNIFIHCLTISIIDRSIHSPNSKKGFSPLLLGAVCKLWRRIAWSTPQLWRSISVDLSGPHISTVVELAKQWLIRSGQMPLSVRLLCRPPGTATKLFEIIDKEDVRALLAVLSHSSGRWRNLDLSIPPRLMRHINSAPRYVYPLESLFLDFNPALQSLDGSSFDLGQTNINYGNLTHVNLHFLDIHACAHILHRAPRLIHCKLFNIFQVRELPLPIEHAHLRSLSFQRKSYTSYSSGDFILSLIIPLSLEELDYEVSRGADANLCLANLLAHSSHSLKRLILKNIRTSSWDPEQLAQASSLTYLRLETDRFAGRELYAGRLNKLFDELSFSIRDPTQTLLFLPHLEVLEIASSLDQFTWSNVYTIFDRHYTAPTDPSQEELQTHHVPTRRPLRRLSIEVYRSSLEYKYIDLDHVQHFKSLIAKGYDIQFFCSVVENGKEVPEDLLFLSAGRCEGIFDLDDL